ncbi:ABC transporter substrate-binding protein [Mycolicibacterium pulveris]|uniref:ABC transporter substrate-binding protein n=1 Tax=Mycolicibacterium pulveris TaxID=36813 RepID=UPI003CEFA293
MPTRRSFLGLLAGGALAGPSLLTACGSGENVVAAAPAVAGTVRTAFNWVPEVGWAPWYLADANGLFKAQRVTTPYVYRAPNDRPVAEILRAGEADVGVAADELQIIQANREGADFVILGAMYQRSPNGFLWLAETPIAVPSDLVGKRIGLNSDDRARVNAVFLINGLPSDFRPVPLGLDAQPLLDGAADVVTCYVTNQPIRLQLKGIGVKSVPYSDFGLKSYGGVLFASRNYVEANRDLLVRYFAGLLDGVDANVADPTAVLPLLKGMDPSVDLAYSEAGNRAYNALIDSDYTRTHGRLMVDPAFVQNAVYPSYLAAGETNLPPVSQLLDPTVLADAHNLV